VKAPTTNRPEDPAPIRDVVAFVPHCEAYAKAVSRNDPKRMLRALKRLRGAIQNRAELP
jgi:hypothetical protein